MKKSSSTGYIFLDESGKPEVFSSKGTNLITAGTASKHLVIVAIRTEDHLAVQEKVTEFRLQILKDKSLSDKFSPSYSLNSFHAQTDYPVVRQKFYEWLRDCDLNLKITAIVAEKQKAYFHLQHDSGVLYATVAGELLKRVLHTAEKVEVIFSRRDSSLRTRESLQKVVDTLHAYFAKTHKVKPDTKVTYHHNPHYTHAGLQIADYVAYAIFQVFEKNNRQWWEIIKDRVGYIQDIFNKKSYSRGNPL